MAELGADEDAAGYLGDDAQELGVDVDGRPFGPGGGDAGGDFLREGD